MSALTVPSRYPYAVGTDFVRDGDNVIAALAQALQDGPGDVTAYRNGSWTMAVGWSKISAWTGNRYASPNAAAQGMTAHTNGITVPVGRYRVDGQVSFLSDGGGTVRRLAIGSAAGSQPTADMPQSHLPAGAGSAPPMYLCVAGTVTMDTAGQIGLFVYTNGIAQALDATLFRLSAQRIS